MESVAPRVACTPWARRSARQGRRSSPMVMNSRPYCSSSPESDQASVVQLTSPHLTSPPLQLVTMGRKIKDSTTAEPEPAQESSLNPEIKAEKKKKKKRKDKERKLQETEPQEAQKE